MTSSKGYYPHYPKIAFLSSAVCLGSQWPDSRPIVYVALSANPRDHSATVTQHENATLRVVYLFNGVHIYIIDYKARCSGFYTDT